MLKALLFVLLSAASYCGLGQNASVAASSVPAVEDSNHIISDVTCLSTEKGSIRLSWKVAGEVPDFFSIERSADGNSFEVVGVLNHTGPLAIFLWTDEAPKKGRTFYRIRYSFGDEQPLFSRTVACFTAGDQSLRFYPNPVDQVLIVRADAPVDVQIADGNGRPRISASRIQGLHTINVSALEKGIYIIRFSDKLTNVISQEKLIKN